MPDDSTHHNALGEIELSSHVADLLESICKGAIGHTHLYNERCKSIVLVVMVRVVVGLGLTPPDFHFGKLVPGAEEPGFAVTVPMKVVMSLPSRNLS